MDSARSIRFVSLAAVVALAGTTEFVAAGDTVRVRTIVEVEELDLVNDIAFGEVRSQRQACKRRREVRLYRDATGPDRELVGTDRTNRRGDWRIGDAKGFPPGEYQAKSRRKTVERSSATIVCGPDSDGFG